MSVYQSVVTLGMYLHRPKQCEERKNRIPYGYVSLCETGFDRRDLGVDLIPGRLCEKFELKAALEHRQVYQPSMSAHSEVLWCVISAAARTVLPSRRPIVPDSSTGLCSTPASVIRASYIIALGEENWAELRNILMGGSPLLLPTMHRRPLSLGTTPGPELQRQLWHLSCPHQAHPQPRGLFPAGGQGCDKSANTGVHPGL